MSRDEQIAAAYRRGVTRGELAKLFGLTDRRIGQIVAKFGVRATHGNRTIHLPPEERKHYVKMQRAVGAKAARAAYKVDEIRSKWVELAALHVAEVPDVYSYSASLSQEAA